MRSAQSDSTVLLVDDPLLSGPLANLATRQFGLLTQEQLREHGVTRAVTRHRVRVGRWRSPTRNLVDVGRCQPRELPPVQRSERTAILGLLAFGPDAIAVGLSALSLYGVWGVPLGTPPQVVVPDANSRRQRNDLGVRRFAPGDDIRLLNGWRAMPIKQALAQAVCEVGPRIALGLLDSARHRALISHSELDEVRKMTQGRRGSRCLAPIWDLVDSRRESPLESWAYYDLWAAGLEPTAIQVTFSDRSGIGVARADIGFQLDDGSWHLIELDGRDFHPVGQRPREVERDNEVALAASSRGGRATTVRYRNHHLGPSGSMVRDTAALLRGRTWRKPNSQAA